MNVWNYSTRDAEAGGWPSYVEMPCCEKNKRKKKGSKKSLKEERKEGNKKGRKEEGRNERSEGGRQ
jgi:hypothetical protein